MKKKLFTAAMLTVAAMALVVATVLGTIAYLSASSAVSNTFTVGNVMIAMYESKVDANGEKIEDDPNINGRMKDSDGNNYHLIPAKTYAKDPTVYVDDSSDKSYLFVKIRNNISSIEYGNFIHPGENAPHSDPSMPTMREQMEAYGWKFYLATPTGNVYVYAGLIEDAAVGVANNGKKLTGREASDPTKTVCDERYQNITDDEAVPVPTEVGGTGKEQIFNLFDTFTIDEHADVSVFGGAKVTLTAFAIQTAGFADNLSTQDKNEAVDDAWAAIVATYPYEEGASE